MNNSAHIDATTSTANRICKGNGLNKIAVEVILGGRGLPKVMSLDDLPGDIPEFDAWHKKERNAAVRRLRSFYKKHPASTPRGDINTGVFTVSVVINQYLLNKVGAGPAATSQGVILHPVINNNCLWHLYHKQFLGERAMWHKYATEPLGFRTAAEYGTVLQMVRDKTPEGYNPWEVLYWA